MWMRSTGMDPRGMRRRMRMRTRTRRMRRRTRRMRRRRRSMMEAPNCAM